jgi:hypothetical protein
MILPAALADMNVVAMFPAAAAFVGVNEQCDDAVTPAIVTVSVAPDCVVKEPARDVLLSPSGRASVLGAETVPAIRVFSFAAPPMKTLLNGRAAVPTVSAPVALGAIGPRKPCSEMMLPDESLERLAKLSLPRKNEPVVAVSHAVMSPAVALLGKLQAGFVDGAAART